MQKFPSATDWWDKRQTVPVATGYIFTSDAPDYSNFFPISGGKNAVFETAADLIKSFESGVIASDIAQLQPVNIELREKISSFNQPRIPLCPNPKATDPASVPQKFCSLGFRVDDNKIFEIWFIARIALSNTGFTWRLDWTMREKATAKAAGALATLLMVVLDHDGTAFSGGSNNDSSEKKKAQQYWPVILHAWNEAMEKIEANVQSSLRQDEAKAQYDEQPNRRD